MRPLPLLLLLTACDTRIVRNDGQACLQQPDEADAAVVVRVIATGSGDTAPVSGSCALTVEGNRVTLTTEIERRIDRTPFSQQLDLRIFTVECETPALPEGTYVLDFDGDELPFVVPGRPPLARCFDGRSGADVDELGTF